MMTSNSSKLDKTPKGKPSPQPKKMSQERIMIMFGLFFLAGVLLLVVVPEEHSARGIVMGIYSVAVFWAMFRFCM